MSIKKQKNRTTKAIHLRHDELFRSIISEPKCYKEFFDAHLPEEVKELIDIESIKVEKSDFLDEKLQESICDVLFSARFKDANDPDEICYLNLLLEAQSRSDKKMSFRMLKYMLMIWQRYFELHPKSKKLPLIYLIIFSNAKSNLT